MARKRQNQIKDFEQRFKCIHCDKDVCLTEYGTKHRNHCPYCLWSKHVDNEIGDRLAECNGPMKPIGLSLKKDGEIMIVHECCKCYKISANRIAGDDDSKAILDLFDKSDIKKIIFNKLVPATDRDNICIQLFGKNRFNDNK